MTFKTLIQRLFRRLFSTLLHWLKPSLLPLWAPTLIFIRMRPIFTRLFSDFNRVYFLILLLYLASRLRKNTKLNSLSLAFRTAIRPYNRNISCCWPISPTRNLNSILFFFKYDFTILFIECIGARGYYQDVWSLFHHDRRFALLTLLAYSSLLLFIVVAYLITYIIHSFVMKLSIESILTIKNIQIHYSI